MRATHANATTRKSFEVWGIPGSNMRMDAINRRMIAFQAVI